MTKRNPYQRTFFVQGLRPEIKRFVLLSKPKTLEEAFRHAKREECNNSIVDNSGKGMAEFEPKRKEELEKSTADLSAQE